MKQNERPNILFFFTDDQRFDTISALGNADVSTPNIDSLVRSGTAFTQAHIPGGTSGAVCMPSRAMLHTGRTLFHLDGAGESIPSKHTMMGEHFGAAGYRTFGTGKWHNGRESFNRGFADGDEIFFGGMSDHWNVPVYHYDPKGTYDTQLPYCEDAFRSNVLSYRDCDHINAGVHSSELLTDAAANFIDGYDDTSPFFLYVSLLAPHDPRTMPDRFRTMYDPDEIELPPSFSGGHPFDNGALHIRDELLAGFPRDPEETKRHIAEYYGMISHLDAQLGKVLSTLEKRGLRDSTLIVFCGDNGLALGRHGLIGKQSCYEHSVRVPLVFSGPGVEADSKCDDFVYLFDIFPTLCDLYGMETPGSVEGRSFASHLRSGAPGTEHERYTAHEPYVPRESLYLAYTGHQRAVKNKRYKLIEYVTGGRNHDTQLFDIQSDPWELENLAGSDDHRKIVNELRREMKRCRDEWEDRKSSWGEAFWSAIEWS